MENEKYKFIVNLLTNMLICTMHISGTFRHKPKCMGRKLKKGPKGQLYVVSSHIQSIKNQKGH